MDYLLPPEIPRLSDDDLRQFVLGVADNQIFTSAHIQPKDFASVGIVVFMTLLGGLPQPEEGVHIPPKPKAPKTLVPPVLIRDPPRPANPSIKAPTLLEPDPKHIEELEFQVRWDRAPKEAVNQYFLDISDQNALKMAEHQATVEECEASFQKELANWEENCRKTADQNAEGQRAYAEAWDLREREHESVLKARKEWQELRDRWCQEYAEQLGVIWEWMSQAGPRSINGYPTFSSHRLLHRDDWERARKALAREQERRESIEV